MAYSVIQWGSGNVGSQVIAQIARRRNLKLKGLFVYNPDKVGMDAGNIAGIKKLGVKATDSVEKILAMDADCVIHSPLSSLVYGDDPEADLKTICALLASGKNVISTVGYMYPKVYGARVVNKLARACRFGNSTFHGTGANPGWLGDLLPLTMSALSGHIDQIVVQEISNFEHYPSPQIVLDTMGFGLSPARFKQRSALWFVADRPVPRKHTDGGGRHRHAFQPRAGGQGVPCCGGKDSQGQHRWAALGVVGPRERQEGDRA